MSENDPYDLTSPTTTESDEPQPGEAGYVDPATGTVPAGTPSGGEPTDKVAPELTAEQRALVDSGAAQETQFIDESVEAGEGVERDVDFVYATHLDPMRQLPGGVYLDDLEREKAEIQRAKIEDREPDLENPPATQGTPLFSFDQLKGQTGVNLDVEPSVTLPVVVSE